ncbi:MAG: hypothetical protein KA224_07775 [Steroidobacteraceae bacterium]|nr:hypothetical protein [Steroidobacteraceae bacterium]
MTGCECLRLNDVERVADHRDFFAGLRQLSVGSWTGLSQCPACGQHWAMSGWEQQATQLATKVAASAAEEWKAISVNSAKEFMLEHRGGTSDETCAWAHCGKPCVKDSAWCIDHLYETGIGE